MQMRSVAKKQWIEWASSLCIRGFCVTIIGNPIINMPVFLQYVTYAVPARYYIDILTGIYLRNTGLGYLWPSMAVLFAFFVALSVLNYRILRKEGL